MQRELSDERIGPEMYDCLHHILGERSARAHVTDRLQRNGGLIYFVQEKHKDAEQFGR